MSTQAAGAAAAPTGQAGANGAASTTSSSTTTEQKPAAPTQQQKEQSPAGSRSMLDASLDAGDDKKTTDKSDGQSAADDKSKDTQSAAAGELTIKIPDGADVDPERIAAFTKFAKETGLNSDQASKAVAWSLEQGKEFEKARLAQNAQWLTELENDPEFGKQNLKASQLDVRRAVTKFFDNETLTAMRAAGVDHLPGFMKALKKIGAEFTEDDSATGSAAGNEAAQRANDREAQLRAEYPSMHRSQQ